jgi:hypothetical protein
MVAVIMAVAIMVVAIMVVAITVVAITVAIMVVAIIEDGAGVEDSGSALDGAGVDGVRGGVPRTIHTMHHPLLWSRNSLQYTSSHLLSKSSRITGITVRNHKHIIHM